MKTLKTMIGTICVCLLATGMVQAQTLSQIDNDTAVADFTNVDFSGQSVTTDLTNWARSDNFTNANLTNTTITLNGPEQPFRSATLVNADFTGATINYTPLIFVSGNARVNAFVQDTRTGTQYAGLTFANTTWNINLPGAEAVTNPTFFNDGPGSLSVDGEVNAADAVNFTGAMFNFTGSGAATLNDDIANLLITNLGDFDGVTPIGAFYDDNFVNNNFTSFGFANAGALEQSLTSAGWQETVSVAVPEPSSLAILGLVGMGLAVTRRRK